MMHVAAPMPRRRLQTARIDVKLRHDVAETMKRRSVFSECKQKRKLPPLRIELKTSGLLNE